jgi:Malate/L-lactate dehydrogenase/Sodium/hydrogen exchanger family
VAPPGGVRAVLGTNPIAIAVPSSRGPIVLDIGTSAYMMTEVMLRERLVLLLFLIGLELEFSRLLALRRAIFGLGAAQLVATAAVLGGLAYWLGLTGWRGAVIGGLALALSAAGDLIDEVEADVAPRPFEPRQRRQSGAAPMQLQDAYNKFMSVKVAIFQICQLISI